MLKINCYIIKISIVIVFAMTMLFSCNSNLKEANRATLSDNEPVGVADSINLKYTDSGRVTANLISSKMLDYTNREFPYNEFPNGITLYLYDEQNKKSTVVSNYAIIYNQTNLIDLQGNVVITTSDSNMLKTEQLYYDQKKEWLFTNQHLMFVAETDTIYGSGFDTDSKFMDYEILEGTGVLELEE
ncbi:MAG: LPS export ABC transporter periplasmic protein LptC [Aestuariibaculum sp.]